MSEELNGRNGYVVGSENYFQYLNKNNGIISILMSNKQKSNYYDTLKTFNTNVNNALDEVYTDLRNNISVIQYIDSSKRENLIKTVEALSKASTIATSSTGRKSDIVSILSLSDSGTKSYSNTSSSELSTAAKIVLNGGSESFSSSDRLKIIADAMERGESYVVSNDERKGNFLYEVAQTTYGKSSDFYKDVYAMAEYYNDSSKYKGRCGYELCSDRYIEFVEVNVFGESVSSYCSGSLGGRDYRSAIENSLKNVADKIEDDLKNIDTESEFLNQNYKNAINQSVKELRNCNISVSSVIEQRINGLYSDIDYFSEAKSFIENIIKKYILKPRPTYGVVGYGIGIEGGVGFYGSMQLLIVRDYLGNWGLIGIVGAGGGFGAGISEQEIKISNVSTIFDLESKKADNLQIGGTVNLGGFSAVGVKSNYGDTDTTLFGTSIGTGVLDIPGKSNANAVVGLGLNMNGQMYYTKLLWYKKVER